MPVNEEVAIPGSIPVPAVQLEPVTEQVLAAQPVAIVLIALLEPQSIVAPFVPPRMFVPVPPAPNVGVTVVVLEPLSLAQLTAVIVLVTPPFVLDGL